MIPTLEQLAADTAVMNGRSILDDRVGMAEILGGYDYPTDDDALDRFEYLIRVNLGLPACGD